MTGELLAEAGREAIVDGKPYRILSVDVADRKMMLRAIRRGELDPPPVPAALDLRDGAPIYVTGAGQTFACFVTDDMRELTKEFITVAFVPHAVVEGS